LPDLRPPNIINMDNEDPRPEELEAEKWRDYYDQISSGLSHNN